jgi:hypothetical protein
MKTPEGEKRRVSVAFAVFSASLYGLILTPVLVNVLGGLVFSGHGLYGPAQGLGSLFFFLSILSAPLGALYWGIVTPLMRAPRRSRRLALLGAIYLLLVLAAFLAIGWDYARSR